MKEHAVVNLDWGESNVARISACVITKNEAQNIQRCLQSLQNSVNEIIVVDTGSDDDTVKIAENMGARIFPYRWENDFSAARNYALTQASGAWIVFLDADEYIAADTVNNVRPFIDRIHGNRKIEAISCLMNNLEGIDGPLRSSNPTIRIFRNSPAIRYRGRIHEAVYKSGKPLRQISVTDRSIVICHTGYTNKTIFAKIQRNTELLEAEVKSGVIRELTYCYLSDGYWRNSEYEKAIEYAQQAIHSMRRLQSEIDYKPYVYLISSMTRLRTYSEQTVTASCNEALARFPHHPEIWLFQGLYFRSIGRCEQALASLLQALAMNEKYSDFNRNNDFYGLSPDAYFTIAQIYEMKNQPAKALEYYVKVLQCDNLHEAAFSGLISLIRKQDPAEIIYFLNTLYNPVDEKVVRFLAANLSQLKVNKVLDYYQQILRERFADNTLNGLALLTNCNFDAVFPALADSLQAQDNYAMELLAVTAVIVHNSPHAGELLAAHLQPSLKKIIAVYFKTGTEVQLTEEDLPVFCEVLGELIHIGHQKQLTGLLNIGKRFYLGKGFTAISTLLLQQRCFDYALEMILAYISQMKPAAKELSLLYCDAGYCCYRRKDFAGAADFFAQALAYGDRRHYIFDFLEWSYQQCPDSGLKERFREMRTLYVSKPD